VLHLQTHPLVVLLLSLCRISKCYTYTDLCFICGRVWNLIPTRVPLRLRYITISLSDCGFLKQCWGRLADDCVVLSNKVAMNFHNWAFNRIRENMQRSHQWKALFCWTIKCVWEQWSYHLIFSSSTSGTLFKATLLSFALRAFVVILPFLYGKPYPDETLPLTTPSKLT